MTTRDVTPVAAHFVFSESFAHSLRQALRQAGREDAAFCLFDDLSFGPIDPPDPAVRFNWIERELKFDLGDIQDLAPTDFWTNVLATSSRRIVWVSKRDARDIAGFLEWVSRLGDESYDVVEFDELEVAYNRPDGRMVRYTAKSLGLLTANNLKAACLWDGATPLDPSVRDQCCATWAKLRAEDAPLRVLTEHGMVSAPISYFDEFLVSCAQRRWLKVARVIGDALAKGSDQPFL
jgi:hypothetical protein